MTTPRPAPTGSRLQQLTASRRRREALYVAERALEARRQADLVSALPVRRETSTGRALRLVTGGRP